MTEAELVKNERADYIKRQRRDHPNRITDAELSEIHAGKQRFIFAVVRAEALIGDPEIRCRNGFNAHGCERVVIQVGPDTIPPLPIGQHGSLCPPSGILGEVLAAAMRELEYCVGSLQLSRYVLSDDWNRRVAMLRNRYADITDPEA